MGRWLAKFSADIPESQTDRTDRRTEKPLLSVLSVPDIDISAQIIPSQPVEEPTPTLATGNRIAWQGADGREQTGVIDFLHSYAGEVWAFCTLPDGEWRAVNVKFILKVEVSL